ncbi:MAG: 4'-phosphopantetheinyl transferase superfamily protein [Deltaproteobacteria bacterium]|nr:MAG: 4'-phosphopantetheinyl transferase superfamily protein [Deltaproteobacteria bacterium]
MAASHRGLRQMSFVGGRMALRLAAQQLGVRPPAIAVDELGAPVLPDGLVGSISHKRTLAVALVSQDFGATLGVDLEEYGPARPAVSSKVLTPEELKAVQQLDPDRQWIATLLRFSLKESIYKAINPHVRRYVGFQEAEVWPGTDGLAAIQLKLEHGEGPFEVEGRYAWLHGRLLTSVRMRPLPPTHPSSS